MNAREIIIQSLNSIGCDGLCNPDIECGCEIDDFIPCDYNFSECVPAKKVFCSNCSEDKNCNYQSEYECDFCFRPHNNPTATE